MNNEVIYCFILALVLFERFFQSELISVTVCTSMHLLYDCWQVQLAITMDWFLIKSLEWFTIEVTKFTTKYCPKVGSDLSPDHYTKIFPAAEIHNFWCTGLIRWRCLLLWQHCRDDEFSDEDVDDTMTIAGIMLTLTSSPRKPPATYTPVNDFGPHATLFFCGGGATYMERLIFNYVQLRNFSV